MPELTLTQAANAAGVTRPTIHKALKSGRLSGRQEGKEWRIDPAELHRVYPPTRKPDTGDTPELSTSDIADSGAKDREIALLREWLEDARAERDKATMALAEATATVKLLTHQATPPVPIEAKPEPRRGWWPFGGKR